MHPKIFSLIGIRLIAVYLFVRMLDPIISGIVLLVMQSPPSQPGDPGIFLDLTFQVVLLVVYGGVSTLLWFYADKLSNRIVAGTPAASTQGTSSDKNEYWVIAFSAVGLFLLVNVIPDIASVVVQIMKMGMQRYQAYPQMPNMVTLPSVIIKLVLALFLLFKSRTIVGLVRKNA